MKKLFYIYFILFCFQANAELQTDSLKYLYTKTGGIGITNITSSNNLISQLVFKGTGIGLFKTLYSEGHMHSWLVNSNFSYAYLSNNANIYGVSHFNYNNNLSILFSINKLSSNNFKLKAGFTGIAYFDIKYKTGNTNNPFAYVCYFSMGVAMHTQYTFSLLKYKSVFNNFICLPAFGLISSSAYAVSQPNFNTKLYSFEPSSFNNNLDFYNNFYIDFKQVKNNQISRFYWRIGIYTNVSYQSLSNNNKLVNTTFYIGRIVKICN